MVEPSIYDQLAKESLSDLTVTQLNSGSSVTAIDLSTINYWKGPITLARILQSSRTYAHGLPMPETSSIEALAVPNASLGTIKPTGTEIWLVQAIDSDIQVTFSLFDGSTTVALQSTATSNPFVPTSPLYLTNNLYLQIYEFAEC